ncbi:MAG: hypothetical protein IPJ65_21710 [Archangiaceae bacterium]|nr:hypothetical protein [Archangiaceae bacterium]
MKNALVWVAVLACGCGSLEGLSVIAPTGPQAVGTSRGLSISRCASRNVLLDCTSRDSVTRAVVALDNDHFGLQPGSFTVVDGKFVFAGSGSVTAGLVAQSAGTTQLSLEIDTAQGGHFTEQHTLEARSLADAGFTCAPYPCLTGLSRLPLQTWQVRTSQGVDSAGERLGGGADYQASGALEPQTPLRYDVGGSGPVFVRATSPGEGRIEPVDARLRSATHPLVVQVAPPDDAEALLFARTLDDGQGRLVQPLATVDFDVELGTRFDPPEPFARIDAWPVIALRDGGWSAVQLDQLYRERPDGGGAAACLGKPPCILDFHAAGESTWFIDAGTRTLRATFTAH